MAVMLGMGRAMIRSIMKKQGVASVEEMIDIAAELEVQILRKRGPSTEFVRELYAEARAALDDLPR